MLRAIGWILFVAGLFAFVGAVYVAFQEPTWASFSIAGGVFVWAFLTPALLFAIADIVQHTRETRDAVLALGRSGSAHSASIPRERSQPRPESDGSSIFSRVEDEEDAFEEGTRARERRTTFADPGDGLVR